MSSQNFVNFFHKRLKIGPSF